ncbi:hypothetical protein D3C87_1509150 [compost metagenome]
MKLVFVLCLLALHGCDDVSHPKLILSDGRWGEYNNRIAEQCAIGAMIRGGDVKEIEFLFNQCVFKQGITI